MMPCFSGSSVGWPESMEIYFHGDYLNLAGSQVREPAERHVGLKARGWQHYALQRTYTRSLKIWILSLAHLLTG